MNSVMARMSRLKRALGLPETVRVLGMVRACPILMVFALLIMAALGVMALS